MKYKNGIISITITSIIIAIIIMGYYYASNGGRFTKKYIDPKMLDDSNPVRIVQNIESCSTATVIVDNFDHFDTFGTVDCKLKDREDVNVFVYLSVDDCTILDIGDIITVRGRVNYTNNSIFIGNSITFFPFNFKAVLIT